MNKGRLSFLWLNRIRVLSNGLFVLCGVTFLPDGVLGQGYAPAIPTFPPIAAPVMLGGTGTQFTEGNYQLFTPSLRKCANDWQSTKYVEYRPVTAGKVTISSRPLKIAPFLETLSEQTGRRFAAQRGIEQEVVVSANEEDWLLVLERYVDTAGLYLENVQDILVISDPKTVPEPPRSKLVELFFAMVFVVVVSGAVTWYFLRPRKRIDPRGGWV